MQHKHKVRYTPQKIRQRLFLIEPLVYRRRSFLPPFRLMALAGPLEAQPVGLDVDDSEWPAIEYESYWGQPRMDFVLRSSFEIPGDWSRDAAVGLHLPLGEAGGFSHPEALAYIDGVPYATCDRHHQEFLLSKQWRDGRPHLLALHGWTGLGGQRSDTWLGAQRSDLYLRPCAVVEIDQPTRDFVTTARVALGIANALDDNEPAKGYLLTALDEAFKILDIREPMGESFYASVRPAHEVLRQGIASSGQPLDVEIVAAGHAHIDVAWLWTLGQTRRKAGRTFHTVLRLMEQFPDYHFTQSQPQLYDYVRQDYPELFDAIKKRIKEGRWETIGGMWIEADCNLSGPESLARQFVLGRSFFRQHFGAETESPVLWLPDVFGYAWNLPQLIKEAGLDYFMTIKIGWSQYNRLPYDSFWWQGLDGTRVLTHFSTSPDIGSAFASTYNANVAPEQVIGTWTNFLQKELRQPLLMIYGYGDGGGGPTREMLENVREMAAFPATPQIRAGRAGDFFRRMEESVGGELPVWNGELYLELHRGTYTTQSRNKRANRKSEFLLHDAEFLSVLASLVEPEFKYPADTLRKAWELVCLNQFHDIVPGSSINPVYVESLQQYVEIQQLGERVKQEATTAIAANISGDLLVVNPTSFSRDDLVFWQGQLEAGLHLQRADGSIVPAQAHQDGTWIAPGTLPPFSVTPLYVMEGEAAPENALSATSELLENPFLRVEFNKGGDISRIYDKTNGREALPPGMLANQWQAFEDRPMFWDAWDVDIFFDDKMWTSEPAESVDVMEAGPVRCTLEIRRRILNSSYIQRVSLAYNSPRLDFDTFIDWRERHIMLKVAFPVDVLTPTATYEIQWGNVERPTHRNTSWDWARFETCAQKWVDLSEGNYGVSLLNDCKYGHDIRDNVMRLSLLRSPTSPDPEADQGEHRFAYSLLPHGGRWNETTVAAAYALNDPLLVIEKGGGADSAADLRAASGLFAIDQPNIVIETVKQAEDGQGLVVRFYESQRRRGTVTLTAGFPLRNAWRTNLLEENQTKLEVKGNRVSLFVRPYEIVTLRLQRA